jgi:hypothetical protein
MYGSQRDGFQIAGEYIFVMIADTTSVHDFKRMSTSILKAKNDELSCARHFCFALIYTALQYRRFTGLLRQYQPY